MSPPLCTYDVKYKYIYILEFSILFIQTGNSISVVPSLVFLKASSSCDHLLSYNT